MREIKFRGKNRFTNTWFYGYLTKEKNKYYITSDTNSFYEVAPETIGQFTGLYDKNITPIYEGDIVQYKPEKTEYVVMFDPTGYWCLDGNGVRNSEMLIQTDDTNKYIEVIGNIYDNKIESGD